MFWMLACSAPDPGSPPPTDGPSTPSSPATPDPTDTDTDTDTDTGTAPTAPLGPENVLLVVIDDVGIDQLALYTEGGLPMPTLDGLAAEGTVFHNAWATPLCSSTRGALLTGRYPTRTGVGSVMEIHPAGEGGGLSHAEITTPEMLARSTTQTWDTSFVGKWHVANLYESASLTDPGDQGFGWYANSAGNLPDYYAWEKSLNGIVTPVTTYATTDVADDAIARIETMAEPWFLQLAFQAPHSPYQAPPEELVPGSTAWTAQQTYQAMLTAVDVELGRVLGSMDPDQRARTTIVVLGDNGTPWDMGYRDPLPGRLKGTIYQSGVQVPFVVAGPRVGVPGSGTDALVSVVDVFPTVAEIAGVSAELGDPTIDGVSFLPVLADPSVDVRETVYTEGIDGPEEWTFAYRDAQYKLLGWQDWLWVGHDDGIELYDLLADPGETVDLVGSPDHADVQARLVAAALAFREELAADPLSPR